MRSRTNKFFIFCLVFALYGFALARADTFDFLIEDDQEEARVPPVTNAFFETDIREVLRDIAAQTGVKIIPDETVQGSISIELKKVPVEEALRLVLSVGNYTFRYMPEGYYLVGMCTPTSPSFNRLSVTEYFQPRYLKARELQSLISEFHKPYIQVNEDVNTLTIIAAPEIVARIKEDLQKFDLAPRQVMIEALVIEISDQDQKSLGIMWGTMNDGGFTISAPAAEATFSKDPDGRTRSITGTLSTDIIARVNLLVAKGKAKVKANPRVATLEGKQAEITVGTEEYAVIEAGPQSNRYSSLQSISSGVILRITPFLDEKQQITVKIAPEVSEVVGKGSSGLPVITKRTASTTLRVDDGQTIAIGGLIQEQKVESTRKTPFLGALPIVGPAFFSNKSTSLQSKEVIILITPHILQDNLLERMRKVSGSLDGKRKMADIAPPQDPAQKYYYDISKRIESNKKFPDFIKEPRRGETKDVAVEFTVFADGMITGATVVNSSGNSFLDENAVKSIEDLSPLPPFPAELKQTNVTFTTTIRYES